MAFTFTLLVLCRISLRVVTTGRVRRIRRRLRMACTLVPAPLIRRTTTIVASVAPYAALLGKEWENRLFFAALSTPAIYDSNLYTIYKFNFMRTGLYGYGYANERAVHGYWWSSILYLNQVSHLNQSIALATTKDANSATEYYYNRGFGFAIRCTIRVE